jgi:hypothetical protein
MDIRIPGQARSRVLTLNDLSRGQTFRTRSSGETVWMITDNKSNHPDRKRQVRTVSLKTGAIAYKEPDLEVILVSGHFQVTDWGLGQSFVGTPTQPLGLRAFLNMLKRSFELGWKASEDYRARKREQAGPEATCSDTEPITIEKAWLHHKLKLIEGLDWEDDEADLAVEDD